MGEIKEVKNQEQSNKAKNGYALNQTVINRINAEKIPIIELAGVEKTFKRNFCGLALCSLSLKPDHWLLIIDKERKVVLSAILDATTTNRDRIFGKAFNGVKMQLLMPEIKSEILKIHPEFHDYKIIHANYIIFPDKVSALLKNKEKEEMYINRALADVNYQTGGLHTQSGIHLLDGAFRIGQFCGCLKYLYEHKLQLTESVLREIWEQEYSIDYDTRELIRPCIENYNIDKNHVAYCLKNFNARCEFNDIKKLAEKLGMETKNKSKKALSEEIIKYIENQNP